MQRSLSIELFFVIAMTVNFAHGRDVPVGGSYLVDSALLFDMICSSDEQVQTHVHNGRIRVYDVDHFLALRKIILENLQNDQWQPQGFQERSDFCALSEAILSTQKKCDGIARERLEDLRSACEDPFIW